VNNGSKREEFIEKFGSNSTSDSLACPMNLSPDLINFGCVHEDCTKSILDQFAKHVAEEGENHELTWYSSEICEIHNDTSNLLVGGGVIPLGTPPHCPKFQGMF
jgi:hypothetical protein